MPNIISYSDDSFRKWTIATVNWKSVDWLLWQLKCWYEFNDPAEFELLIFDGMFPNSEMQDLERICEPYKKYKNIKLLSWSSADEKQSDFGEPSPVYYGTEHGNELTQLLRIANSQYFLSNDPDHFWMIPNHLKLLQRFMDKGFGSVGAVNNFSDFVAIWAGAYKTVDVKDLNASATWTDCVHCKKRLFVHGQDTGWQLRLRTSNQPKFVFPQMLFNLPFLGPWSYPDEGQYRFYKTYMFEKNPIAVHFFRGQYPLERTSDALPEEWKVSRQKYGEYFYNICSSSSFDYSSCTIP